MNPFSSFCSVNSSAKFNKFISFPYHIIICNLGLSLLVACPLKESYHSPILLHLVVFVICDHITLVYFFSTYLRLVLPCYPYDFRRLCLDQGFSERKRNENGKCRWSNDPKRLDRLTFPFLFPFLSPNSRSKHSLNVFIANWMLSLVMWWLKAQKAMFGSKFCLSYIVAYHAC